MKECYYTKDTIKDQSISFKKEIGNLIKKNWYINPDKTAFLIMDMQNFFLDKDSHAYVPSAKAIIPKIKEVGAELLNFGSDIIFTRHINTKENSNNMSIWWRDILTENDRFSQINKELYIEHSPIIIKSQYDAFFNTNLEDILKESGKNQIIISGVMSHLCCETTARSAFIRGFEVFFGIDLTATYNRKFHSATLLNLSHGFAVPLLADEITGTGTAGIKNE